MTNKKRLIDANDLKEQIIKEIHYYWNNGDGGYYLAEDVIPDIEDAPTVDAVEVVRCKDCKHWSYIPGLDKCPHCVVFCGLHSKAYQTKSDDFCSYGERKESEQT